MTWVQTLKNKRMYHLSINAGKLLEYLGNNDNGHEIIDSKVGRQILKFKKNISGFCICHLTIMSRILVPEWNQVLR